MGINILTEEQARAMATECGLAAVQMFIEKYLPGFQEFQKAPMPSENDQMMTVKQLAEYWQCHPQTIMQKKRKGELVFHQHGRKLFFKRSEIDALTANTALKKKGAKI